MIYEHVFYYLKKYLIPFEKIKTNDKMGEQRVELLQNQKNMHRFVRDLLRDVEALQYMLDNDWFENDVTRIGAEQEMVLVEQQGARPASVAMEILEEMKNPKWLETELAKFNLETNLKPQEFKGKCLSKLEKENLQNLEKIQKTLHKHNIDYLLTGILPTLHKKDLDFENLTPKPRYFALMQAISDQLIGKHFELRLMGIDEILVRHDSPLLEACNTSFQVHLQVAPDDFVHMYNIAQALAAPVIAIGANSPIVFGKRLWHESRIALFQQALDIRTTHDHMRDRSPRVSFGKGWLKESIMEIYKEDIARFRPLIAGEEQEDSLELLKKGITPKLRALQVHNSTVYRWNRPCYGISPNGKPHLRIENRVLPSGPTVIDELSNAAFWLGAMVGISEEVKDIRNHISWEDVRDNFAKAAKFGIDTQFTWFNDEKIGACDLILKLLPIARKGLESKKVNKEDIDRYLGIIEARTNSHMNGARWQLRAFTELIKQGTRDEALTALTESMIKHQNTGIPVHEWPMPNINDIKSYRPHRMRVDEFMTTDLFTVREDDLIEIIAELMDWEKIRHMPIEDNKGNLVGLLTSRILLRHFTRCTIKEMDTDVIAKDLMIREPITIGPDANILDAMDIMRSKKIGCLPVVKNGELIGIITEKDFLEVTASLLSRG